MASDRTLDLIRTGYPWASRLRNGAPAVPVRVLGRAGAVVGGPEGVRRFYDARLRRRGAVPAALALMLFGPGTVHGIDDAEHHLRKALFLGIITPDTVAALGRRADEEWDRAVAGRAPGEPLVVFDEAVRVLASTVLPWAGVPVTTGELPRRAHQLATVLDGFGVPGPAYVRAVRARLQVGRWTRRLIRDTRRGRIRPPEGTALYAARTPRERRRRCRRGPSRCRCRRATSGLAGRRRLARQRITARRRTGGSPIDATASDTVACTATKRDTALPASMVCRGPGPQARRSGIPGQLSRCIDTAGNTDKDVT